MVWLLTLHLRLAFVIGGKGISAKCARAKEIFKNVTRPKKSLHILVDNPATSLQLPKSHCLHRSNVCDDERRKQQHDKADRKRSCVQQ